MPLALETIRAYLDTYLEHGAFSDYKSAMNGLQVEAPGPIAKIAAAVDACQFTIDAAATAGAQLLLVHHGLFWRGVQPVTGATYRRLRRAFAANLAIYSSHLPLDAHPECGNNAGLLRAMGLEPGDPFGEHDGRAIGFLAECDLGRDAWVAKVADAVGSPPQLLALGPDRIRRFAVVTGAASNYLGAAKRAGCDALLTGEAPHHAFHEAEEQGMNLCLAGHYATECFGVKLLAEHLAARYGLQWLFIDHPTGL